MPILSWVKLECVVAEYLRLLYSQNYKEYPSNADARTFKVDLGRFALYFRTINEQYNRHMSCCSKFAYLVINYISWQSADLDLSQIKFISNHALGG